MTKEEMADLVIERLNEIASHDPMAMKDLIKSRVSCNERLADHPTVQVHQDRNHNTSVGFLGMLNGLVGTIPDGPLKGLGYVMAVFDAHGAFSHFRRSDADDHGTCQPSLSK